MQDTEKVWRFLKGLETHRSIESSRAIAESREWQQLVPLDKPIAGRYMRFVALHVIDDGNYVTVAGLGVVEA